MIVLFALMQREIDTRQFLFLEESRSRHYDGSWKNGAPPLPAPHLIGAGDVIHPVFWTIPLIGFGPLDVRPCWRCFLRILVIVQFRLPNACSIQNSHPFRGVQPTFRYSVLLLYPIPDAWVSKQVGCCFCDAVKDHTTNDPCGVQGASWEFPIF